MSGAAFWAPIWAEKGRARESVAAMSGRSTYTTDMRCKLASDAAVALDLNPDDFLVDIGCAAGFTGEILRIEPAVYIGVDYSGDALRAFMARCPGVNTCHASALDLPFRDGEFSKSLMGSVLLCLTKDECRQALTEMRRVTTDRGFVSGNLEAGKASVVHEHCTWFTRDELVDLALSCGWSRAEAVDISPELTPHASFMFDLKVWA
jgi:ubiquinone/menaquinone biosynthesis C-methylase UbiE